jgi:peptidyl-prolyl cis-trans isomerase B (cyclophilin B)
MSTPEATPTPTPTPETTNEVQEVAGEVEGAATGLVGKIEDEVKAVVVKLETTLGDIKIALNPEKAKTTVENFINYVKAGLYDNTIFHRVIDGFMIQGGGFTSDMKQKPTEAPITNEANNGLKNTNYSIAMARTNDPHSATSQFFINVNDNDFLNHTSPTPQGWGYAVFGEVTEGHDVVDAIKKVKTGSKGFHQDVPADPIVIKHASIVDATPTAVGATDV